jgi:hypothetical protein
MIAKLFNPDARLGHAVALSISLAALAGCGGKVLDVDGDGGRPDSVASDTTSASDSFEPDTFTPPPVEDSSVTITDATSSTACSDCVGAKCRPERDACTASADCIGVIKCINDCGSDNTCANACISDEAKPGVSLASDLIACAQDKCGSECML